ncbi:MAG: hypothetical protein JO352_22340 [Chloroflexi bacterium]|nr:hypothetical protein [Chloroflexota bacterium]MBV9596383.1 hypothetical protein [Chloroflexota bacterium]
MRTWHGWHDDRRCGHEAAAPAAQSLVALCDEIIVLLRRAAWAYIEELVGFSTTMTCGACALIDLTGSAQHNVEIDHAPQRRLRVLP